MKRQNKRKEAEIVIFESFDEKREFSFDNFDSGFERLTSGWSANLGPRAGLSRKNEICRFAFAAEHTLWR